MSAGSIEQEPSRKLACCGVPLITEDMQSLAIRTLSGTDINKHYDLIRELGKGTYGKVDLVSHKSTGELHSAPDRLGGKFQCPTCQLGTPIHSGWSIESFSQVVFPIARIAACLL